MLEGRPSGGSGPFQPPSAVQDGRLFPGMDYRRNSNADATKHQAKVLKFDTTLIYTVSV
jgi:hypothetical protein